MRLLMTRLFRVALWSLLLVALTLGCFRKPASSGSETDLFVFADSTTWTNLEPTLRDVFERTIETPQPEKVFELIWLPPEKRSQYSTRKNLMYIGVLDEEGAMADQVRRMLSPEVRNLVEDGEKFVFTKEEPWARGQVLLVLASPTREQLQQHLQQNKDFVYNLLKTKLLEDTKEQMFAQLEQKDIEKKLLEKYGWMVRVQHDYIINVERPQDRFVMLRRSLPDRERWLFVHWIENGDPEGINPQWAMRTRNRLTEKFYHGDTINEAYTTAQYQNFLGRSALVLEGLWENEARVVGGPFRNYSFYDVPSDRIYMIDIAVFYPGGEKEPFLRQLDIMAHTFRTAHEISVQELETSD